MPSYLNWTPTTPTSSEASAVTVIVPETVDPGAGDVMLTAGGTLSLEEPTVIPPLAAMETTLSPTGTIQTPSALLALAVVGVHPTLSSVTNSVEPSRSTLWDCPCHCRGTFPMGAAVNRSGCANRTVGPASMSTHRLWRSLWMEIFW